MSVHKQLYACPRFSSIEWHTYCHEATQAGREGRDGERRVEGGVGER